jgi:hypothetical protein
MGLFLSGALLAFGTCAWYYGAVIDQRIAAYDRQVDRLVADVDAERTVNRDKLDDISSRVSGVAVELSAIAQLVKLAATTARSAATTAKGAATNAAKANVTVTEIPAPPKRKRIETRDVEP